MPRCLPREVRIHLDKARESALLAVEVYNKPATTFRSGGYIVLMCIAWTSLFHAIFLRQRRKPFYRDPQHPRRYAKIDGDYKAWELSECLDQYYGSQNSGERTNLRFFIGLRNKIEHRSMPALDVRIFGECQALLFNFEDTLFREFGAKYALNESLSLALQFSQLRDPNQAAAIRRLHSPLARDVEDYIASFRSALSTEELHDLKFSYKVFLVPKLANHPGQADVAVEFRQYDPNNPTELAEYKRLAALIKPTVMQVANQGLLKAGDVCKQVLPVVQQAAGPSAKFHPSYHHVKACYFYRVRPARGSANPAKTDLRYCHYDEAHRDYLYTHQWVTFLKTEMKKPGQYERVCRRHVS